MIAGTLKGVISQRLVRTADGKGRVACCEILVKTGRVHDMILDPKMTDQIHEVIAEGAYYGMQTFDQHLLQHLQAGRITMEEALKVATSPHDFKLMVAAETRDGAAPAPAAPPAPATDPDPAMTVELAPATEPEAPANGHVPAVGSAPPPGS